ASSSAGRKSSSWTSACRITVPGASVVRLIDRNRGGIERKRICGPLSTAAEASGKTGALRRRRAHRDRAGTRPFGEPAGGDHLGLNRARGRVAMIDRAAVVVVQPIDRH